MDSHAGQLNSPEPYSVFIGSWTNWSHGRIFGATTTLTRRDGNLLIAFIALFVTFVGTCCWRIACYVLHSFYSTKEPEDAIYHQRQVILRNSANAATAVWTIFEALWAWRYRASRLYRRMVPLIGFTLFHISAFAVAGIFSSRVSNGNEVLLAHSNLCGTYFSDQSNSSNATDWSTIVSPWVTNNVHTATYYAMECYEKDSTIANCETYVRNRLLPQRVIRNASCPFQEKMCHGQDKNLLIDTGYLDSHTDFGLNAPPNDRFLYRKITRCAPLVTQGYVDYYVYPDAGLNATQARYYYGKTEQDAFTYQHHTTLPGDVIFKRGRNYPGDYDVNTVTSQFIEGKYTLLTGLSEFIPIRELQANKSDISMFFLSGNDIVYMDEVNDPWFNATAFVGYIEAQPYTGATGWQPKYFSNQPVSTLGCTTQHQFCTAESNPSQRQCTEMLGQYMPDIAQSNHFADHSSAWGWAYFFAFRLASEIDDVVRRLGVMSLLARKSLTDTFQGRLPDNQWQLEVEHWHAVSMASLQASFVTVATGPSDNKMANSAWWLRDSEADWSGCRRQKIRSLAYTSFSNFGLVVTFTIGGLLVIISYSLEPFLTWIQKRHKIDPSSRLEWAVNETLQLQRLAHEELNVGTWSRAAESVPVTIRGQTMALLDVSNPEHPRLKAAAQLEEPHPQQETELNKSSDRISGNVASDAPEEDSQGVSAGQVEEDHANWRMERPGHLQRKRHNSV